MFTRFTGISGTEIPQTEKKHDINVPELQNNKQILSPNVCLNESLFFHKEMQITVWNQCNLWKVQLNHTS